MRRLGQHWMVDTDAIRAMVNALELCEGDVIVEIGPGKGALTLPLVKRCQGLGCMVIAIEKDKNLIKILRNTIEINRSKVELIEGDALKIIPQVISHYKLSLEAARGRQTASYKLVGNIPYYITGRLLRLITESKKPPALAVLTIQRDVAERLTATPPRMNLLAAAVQYAAQPEIIMQLTPGSFYPSPKVRSSIMKITDIRAPDKEAAGAYYRFIKAAFAQPRKQLAHCLAKMYGRENVLKTFSRLGMPPTVRAHELNLSQLESLSRALGG